MILLLAVSVNFKAQTLIFGQSRKRMSSVTVPTQTAILPSFSFMQCATRCRPRGRLFLRVVLSLFRITLLNFESDLRQRNLYSLQRSLMYGFSDLVTRGFFLVLPWSMSIPMALLGCDLWGWGWHLP